MPLWLPYALTGSLAGFLSGLALILIELFWPF